MRNNHAGCSCSNRVQVCGVTLMVLVEGGTSPNPSPGDLEFPISELVIQGGGLLESRASDVWS